MSATLADIEREVRYSLRDRNPQGQAFTSPEVVHAIEPNMRSVASRLLLGEEQVSALITTVAGTQFYNLPGTLDYQFVRYLRSQDEGQLVEVLAPAVFEMNRQGDGTRSVVRGRPIEAMFRETAAQQTQIGFWPTPDAAYVFDGYRTLLPAKFFVTGTGVLANLPQNTVIPFDDDGCNALILETAADLFAMMPQADRQRLKLADTAAQSFRDQAEEFVKASRRRRIYQLRTLGGNRGGRRW
jgi:hypothetical protein